MKNPLNKILIGLAFVLCTLGIVVSAADKVMTADPAVPGKTKVTTIPVVNNQVAGTDTVTAGAVVGVSVSGGAGDAGKVPKLNGSGLLDPSFISVAASTNRYSVGAVTTGGNVTWSNSPAPTAGQVLVADGAGNATWSAQSGSGGGAGGGSPIFEFTTTTNATKVDLAGFFNAAGKGAYTVYINGPTNGATFSSGTDYYMYFNSDFSGGNYQGQSGSVASYALSSHSSGHGAGKFNFSTYPGKYTQFNGTPGASTTTYNGWWSSGGGPSNVTNLTFSGSGGGGATIPSNTTFRVFQEGGGSAPLLVSTNSGSTFTGAGVFAWSTMFTLTTTATTGTVSMVGQAYSEGPNPWGGVRIVDGNTNLIAALVVTDYGDAGTVPIPYKYNVSGIDTLTGTAKTYNFQVMSSVGSRPWATNQTSFAESPVGTPLHYLKILQFSPP